MHRVFKNESQTSPLSPMTLGWCAWYVPGMGSTHPHQANGPGQQPSPTARRQRPSHPPRSVRRACARWRPLSRHPTRTLAPPSSLQITPLDLSCRFCNCSNSTWRHRFAASVRVLGGTRQHLARVVTTLPFRTSPSPTSFSLKGPWKLLRFAQSLSWC